MPDHTEVDQPLPEDANLKFLRRLVTTLTVTMILGIAIIVVLMVVRLNQDNASTGFTDDLPALSGVKVSGLTRTQDHWIAVTSGNEILILDPSGSKLIQRITIEP